MDPSTYDSHPQLDTSYLEEVIAKTRYNGLKPKSRLTILETAEKYRILNSACAAEPGRYRVNRTPYLREVY